MGTRVAEMRKVEWSRDIGRIGPASGTENRVCDEACTVSRAVGPLVVPPQLGDAMDLLDPHISMHAQVFNIHVNGSLHCSVRYSALLAFHEKVGRQQCFPRVFTVAV